MGSNILRLRRLRRRRPIPPATTSPTSFYKIILPSIMLDHKMRIPEDFAKKHGNELSTSATFTVRGGRVCHVGVEKSDNMIWFTDGWKEFAENYSIHCGFFLVFNYEGNSKFKVLIFDLTATEIHNNLWFSEEPNQRNQCPLPKKVERGDDDSVEILGCSPSRPPPTSSEKKIHDQSRDQWSTGKRCCQSLLQKMFYFAPEFAFLINKGGRCLSSMESLRSNSHYLTRNKRSKIGDQGKVVELEDVTVSCRGKRKADEMSSSQRSSLDKPKKEKWNPTENHIDSLDREGHDQVTDADFLQDAPVRSKDRQQLKVKEEEEEEFPAVNNSRNVPTRRPVTKQEREKAVNAAMMFKPKNPFFMRILKLYNVNRSFVLSVPASFAKKNLHGGSDSVELQVSGGKQWTVSCIRSANGTVQCLSKGWKTFVYDNHLSEGDVCVFEFIHVKHVLKVSMFRPCEDTRN